MIKDLPAIDNTDIRELNTKKIVSAAEDIGQHFKELKKQNRVNFVVGLTSSLIILIFLGVIVYTAFSTKGVSFIDGMVDRDLMAQRYNCTYQNHSAIFRNPSLAKDFLIVYPQAVCVYRDVRE